MATKKKSYRVKVLKANIKKGIMSSGSKCPIALALKRQFKASNIAVDGSSIEVDGRAFTVPKRAVNFIDRFDLGKKVKPFEFTIREVIEEEPELDNTVDPYADDVLGC